MKSKTARKQRQRLKPESDGAALSVQQSAALLRVSPPTIRRMAAQGDFECFRTPGGHLRIVASSLRGLTNGSTNRGNVSPVRNKQDEVEDVRLQVQLLREKRELDRLRREQEAEATVKREEQDTDQRRISLEQEKLRIQRESIKFHQAQERAARRAEKELAAFRSKWLEKGIALCPGFLCGEKRQEIADALRVEIERRQPYEDPIMGGVVQDILWKHFDDTERMFWLVKNVRLEDWP
jgi:excisionase family DNA binding protein